MSGAWSGWVAAMGEVGGGEWYCRGWRVPGELMVGLPGPELDITSRGRCVWGVEGRSKTTECLGQVRREGEIHVVGVKAWFGHAAWEESECVLGHGTRMVLQPFYKVQEMVWSKVGILAGRLMDFWGCCLKES